MMTSLSFDFDFVTYVDKKTLQTNHDYQQTSTFKYKKQPFTNADETCFQKVDEILVIQHTSLINIIYADSNMSIIRLIASAGGRFGCSCVPANEKMR